MSAAAAKPAETREREYWTPEPIFAGATVFCLAPGPSLTAEIAARTAGRRSIAVNSACRLAPFADVLFFTDSGWYDNRFADGLRRRDFVRDFAGLVVSMSRTAKREQPDKVRRIRCIGSPEFPPRRPGRTPGFPPTGSGEVQQGRSSGHTAVALAIALGAARVVLVGYDMRLVNGREHCHAGEPDYQGPRDLSLYEREFVPGFTGWQAAAEASGVEILNATPGSAVKEFPMAALEDALADGR